MIRHVDEVVEIRKACSKMGHVPSDAYKGGGHGRSVEIGGGGLNDIGGCCLGGEAMYGLGSF